MAAPPLLPVDWVALIPTAGDPKCEAYAKVFVRIPQALARTAAWAINPDGTPTDDFKSWIGTLAPGTPDEIIPRNLSASDDQVDKITVQWGSVPAARSYEVWRGTTMILTELTVIASGVSGTTHIDTSAIPGTTYYYAVRAVTADTTSGYSNIDAGVATTNAVEFPPRVHSSVNPQEIVVPATATKMDVELWGAGGRGGSNYQGGFVSGPVVDKKQGGGGASGGYWKVADVTVTAGHIWVISAGNSGGVTSIYRKDDDTQHARLPYGPNNIQDGKDAAYAGGVQDGAPGQPASVNIETTIGTGAWTNGNAGVGTEGGEPVVGDNGKSAGRGATGSLANDHPAGANGMIVIQFKSA